MQFNFKAEQTCTTVYWEKKGELDFKVSTFAVRSFLLLSKASASSSCGLCCCAQCSLAMRCSSGSQCIAVRGIRVLFLFNFFDEFACVFSVYELVNCHTVTLWVDGPLITDSKRQLSQFFCLLHL